MQHTPMSSDHGRVLPKGKLTEYGYGLFRTVEYADWMVRTSQREIPS